LRHLVGSGVSAAAIWLLRRTLDEAGFTLVKIVASSGFGPAKCRMMAAANAPIDVIGTGSYLPELWSETYATADIIAYDGVPMVKAGREFPAAQAKGRIAPALAGRSRCCDSPRGARKGSTSLHRRCRRRRSYPQGG